jgi:hypothetical protein
MWILTDYPGKNLTYTKTFGSGGDYRNLLLLKVDPTGSQLLYAVLLEKWDGPPPETLGSGSAKTRRLKSWFKQYPGLDGGNKDGNRPIQLFRNLISADRGRQFSWFYAQGARQTTAIKLTLHSPRSSIPT